METIFGRQALRDRPLFRVDGDLVDCYNRCLERVRGIRTALTSFTIDKRGVSPEIMEEHGECYLQNGPSHRYMIVLSPEQKDVPLLCEEFSFDDEVIDFFFANSFPAITLATRVDGIYVELDDRVNDFLTPDDLLLVRTINMEGHTPSGFLTRARELQRYVAMLQDDPELLISDDSGIPHRIQELVAEIGDVRGYNLSNTTQTIETGNFFTSLFGGVYVFREKAEKVIKARRPSRRTTAAVMEIIESGEPLGERITAIVVDEKQTITESDSIRRIPLCDDKEVLRFLLGNGFAAYSADSIGPRIARIEDEMLLSAGFAVGTLGYEERCRALESVKNTMPTLWHELLALKRKMQLSGLPFNELIVNEATDLRKVLLAPAGEGGTRHVVAHLITKLFPFDYELMAADNTAGLAEALLRASEQKQRYIRMALKPFSSPEALQ